MTTSLDYQGAQNMIGTMKFCGKKKKTLKMVGKKKLFTFPESWLDEVDESPGAAESEPIDSSDK
jgi:hypothetical protein